MTGPKSARKLPGCQRRLKIGHSWRLKIGRLEGDEPQVVAASRRRRGRWVDDLSSPDWE